MNDAASLFLGEHDWTAFASAHTDGESKIRDIRRFNITSKWDERARASLIEFEITANGFLRYMVRSIVGTLIEVGRGERDLETVQTGIVTGDRKCAGMTASAKGLTLLKVDYD
jgi:tRNA pseudouridine38-40 synthase